MTRPQPWMTALLDVTLRTAETPDQEVAEPLFRAREVVGGVHRPEDVVLRHLRVEGPHQPRKACFTDRRIEAAFVDFVHTAHVPIIAAGLMTRPTYSLRRVI